MNEPRSDEYADAAVHRKLAEEICEQGIEVIRRDGSVLVRGQVESAARRAEIGDCVAAAFPDRRVQNDIVVTTVSAPPEPEVIS